MADGGRLIVNEVASNHETYAHEYYTKNRAVILAKCREKYARLKAEGDVRVAQKRRCARERANERLASVRADPAAHAVAKMKARDAARAKKELAKLMAIQWDT